MITLDIHGNTASICIDGVWRTVTNETIESHPWILKYLSGPVALKHQAKQLLDEIEAMDERLKS